MSWVGEWAGWLEPVGGGRGWLGEGLERAVKLGGESPCSCTLLVSTLPPPACHALTNLRKLTPRPWHPPTHPPIAHSTCPKQPPTPCCSLPRRVHLAVAGAQADLPHLQGPGHFRYIETSSEAGSSSRLGLGTAGHMQMDNAPGLRGGHQAPCHRLAAPARTHMPRATNPRLTAPHLLAVLFDIRSPSRYREREVPASPPAAAAPAPRDRDLPALLQGLGLLPPHMLAQGSTLEGLLQLAGVAGSSGMGRYHGGGQALSGSFREGAGLGAWAERRSRDQRPGALHGAGTR